MHWSAKVSVFVCLSLGAWLGAQNQHPLADGEAHGDPPFLLEPGWTPLLNGKDLRGWHVQTGHPMEWFTTRGVRWDPQDPKILRAAPSPGDRIVNGPKGRTAHIVTDRQFGDVELYVEFMVPKESNSGVYLHGLYEIQVRDSYGTANPTLHDCGGVYERWIDGKGVGGHAPLTNASLPAGRWQSFQIWFRAPRFGATGQKIEKARFLRVLQNGVLIQENVEVDGPTRASLEIPEAPKNPLMLQGDHGAVAYRNLYIRDLRPIAK